MLPRKYRLKDGSIYWSKFYYDIMPRSMIRYSPPGGSYNYATYLYQPWKYLIELYDHAKYFIQRGHRGYSDRDIWGWYSHHARVMVGVLKQLRFNMHGHPVGLTPAKWDRKLQIMAAGFQAVVDEENDVVSFKALPRVAYLALIRSRKRKLSLALKYFKRYYQNLWD